MTPLIGTVFWFIGVLLAMSQQIDLDPTEWSENTKRDWIGVVRIALVRQGEKEQARLERESKKAWN